MLEPTGESSVSGVPCGAKKNSNSSNSALDPKNVHHPWPLALSSVGVGARSAMDALRKVYNNSQTDGFKRSVRELKNKAYGYTEMEQLAREATCNEPSEASSMLLKEIAKGTFTVDFSSIMSIVWKRIRNKNSEHHPYKCLHLIEFLLREGNVELVMQQVNNNLHLIQVRRGPCAPDCFEVGITDE